MPPITQVSMTPGSRINNPSSFYLPATHLLRTMSSNKPSEKRHGAAAPTPVVIPSVASDTAAKLLSSWMGPLIAQDKTGLNDNQFVSFWLTSRELQTSGVLFL